MLNGVMALHDIRDTEKLCRRILDNHLRKTRATLNHHDTEDAVSYLIETAWELSLRYDPNRNTSFSKYAYSVLALRIVDWYRTRYYRDQTSSDWYRRTNPNTTHDPDDIERRRNFHFPTTLDTDTQQPAQEDHRDRDTLAFALRARNTDPLADCAPALYDALARGFSETTQVLDLRPAKPHPRATRRDRKAA